MRNIRKSFYWLFALCFFSQGIAQAQTLGPDTESAATLEFDSSGIFYVTGAGTGTLSLSGAGTRMFWYPGKAAFRAGSVSGGQWDDGNIGSLSVAFGSSAAAGNTSTAFGSSTGAIGPNSTAFGALTVSSGGDSTTFGLSTTATKLASTAFGNSTLASGMVSTAFGNSTIASGGSSLSAGVSTTAQAYASFAIGRFNVGGFGTGGDTTWLSADPLFEIGNGTGTGTSASDAFVVYKNGSAKLQGPLAAHSTIRCAAGGDLSMGSFTAGTPP